MKNAAVNFTVTTAENSWLTYSMEGTMMLSKLCINAAVEKVKKYPLSNTSV